MFYAVELVQHGLQRPVHPAKLLDRPAGRYGQPGNRLAQEGALGVSQDEVSDGGSVNPGVSEDLDPLPDLGEGAGSHRPLRFRQA